MRVTAAANAPRRGFCAKHPAKAFSQSWIKDELVEEPPCSNGSSQPCFALVAP